MSASARVGLLVSAEVPPKDPAAGAEIAGLPMGDAAAVAQAFTDGFRAHLPEVKIEAMDEALRKFCVDGAPKSSGTDSIVLAVPGLVTEGCHAQVERLGLHYLILIGGVRSTTSAFESGGGGGGIAFGTHHYHAIKLRAHAFDTVTGALVCDRDLSAGGSSYLGVAIIGGGMGAGLIPLIEVLDETAYWKDTAWRLGYVIAGCFVQPTADTTTPVYGATDVVEAPDTVFPNAVWWFKRTHRVSGRLLVSQSGLVFLERLPSGGEAAYPIHYAEIKSVSLDYSNKQEPLILIRRQDGTTEHFLILQANSAAIDTEGTQSTYQLVKERAAASNQSWEGSYTPPPKPSN